MRNEIKITLNVPIIYDGMIKVSSGILLTPLPSEIVSPAICINILMGDLYARLERKNSKNKRTYLKEILMSEFHLIDVTYSKLNGVDTVILHHPDSTVEHNIDLFVNVGDGTLVKPYILDN